MSHYHHGDLRAGLLRRAIEIIAQSGVEGLSLRQLARDLEVSHAAPARHFKTKADLLAAIVADGYGALTERLYLRLDERTQASPRDILAGVTQDAINWARENPARFSVMTNPDVSRFAQAEIKASLTAFSAAIRSAIKDAREGAAPIAVDNETYLLFAIGSVLGVSMLLTDNLMRETIGHQDDNTAATISKIADLIVSMR